MLDLIGNPPLFTLSVFILCLLTFIGESIFGGVGSLCLLPSRIISRLELYRIFTFPFIHGGFFHILFNMIAWLYLGKDFERSTGSFAAFYVIIMLLIPITSFLHITASYVFDFVLRTKFHYSCTIGLSGVLFSLLVIGLEASSSDAVSIFGLFNMPSRLYPWVLAALLQLFAPGLSLLGHLSGICMGYAITFGYFNRLTPSDYKFSRLEERLNLKNLPLWQSVNAASLGLVYGRTLPRSNDSDSGFMSSLKSWWGRLTSRFSRNTTSDEGQPFFGQGYTLGGATQQPAPVVRQPAPVTQPRPVGRIPLTSRLIREAESGAPRSDPPQGDAEQGGVAPEE